MRFFTPPVVKKFIQAMVLCTFSALFLENVLPFSFKEIVLLNPSCFFQYRLWQPLTAAFFLPCKGLSFSALFDLSVLVGMLWIFSSQLFDFLGKKRPLFLFFSTALMSSLVLLASLYFFSATELFPLTPFILLALATAWTMCAPQQNFFMFFFFPFQAKWFLALALLGTVGASAIQGDFIYAIGYFATFLWSYLLCVMKWYIRGPFSFLWRFEAKLKRISHSIALFFNWKVYPLLRRYFSRTAHGELVD